MAKLLFRLRFVPDDEADDVRQLLDDNDIGWFETSPATGAFPCLESGCRTARILNRRDSCWTTISKPGGARMREEYELDRQRGQARTVAQMFLENPLRFVSYIVLIGVVLFLSLRFFSVSESTGSARI